MGGSRSGAVPVPLHAQARAASSASQLWLVKPVAQAESQDPARRLFDHWVFMLGKPARTQFGPTRRQAVAAWLRVYELDVLMMAVEGCAADPWACGENRTGMKFNDLTDILRDEARIERYADVGEQLRAQAAERAARAARGGDAVGDGEVAPVVSPEEAAAARDALRALAARMSGRGGAR